MKLKIVGYWTLLKESPFLQNLETYKRWKTSRWQRIINLKNGMEIEGQDIKSAFFHSASEPKVKVLLNPVKMHFSLKTFKILKVNSTHFC